MSIYATVGQIGMKRFRDNAYFDILVQAVPPHIVNVGPAWEFLPPPVEEEGRLYRAVFFVEAGEPKGTARSGQEYPSPLIKLTGQEYHDIRFVDLILRLENALDARYGVPEWKTRLGPNVGGWYVD